MTPLPLDKRYDGSKFPGKNCLYLVANLKKIKCRAVARALIGGGGCIFIYSGSARLVSFVIKLISKEVSRAEPEYMNKHPPPN